VPQTRVRRNDQWRCRLFRLDGRNDQEYSKIASSIGWHASCRNDQRCQGSLLGRSRARDTSTYLPAATTKEMSRIASRGVWSCMIGYKPQRLKMSWRRYLHPQRPKMFIPPNTRAAPQRPKMSRPSSKIRASAAMTRSRNDQRCAPPPVEATETTRPNDQNIQRSLPERVASGFTPPIFSPNDQRSLSAGVVLTEVASQPQRSEHSWQ
jgi:hypothetical protein